MSEKCEWEWYYDGFYTTACGQSFCFNDGDLEEPGFDFCPYCGKKIRKKGKSWAT